MEREPYKHLYLAIIYFKKFYLQFLIILIIYILFNEEFFIFFVSLSLSSIMNYFYI
jgi:hypothetical protein